MHGQQNIKICIFYHIQFDLGPFDIEEPVSMSLGLTRRSQIDLRTKVKFPIVKGQG